MRIGGLRLDWITRRWWLLVGSVIGVVVVALVVQRPAPNNDTAEAVLLVRSGATLNTPGSANEANRLAVTYSQAVPLDAQVLDSVARTLNAPRSEVEGRVSATNDPNTSILRVRYAAGNGARAVDGARAVANALAGPVPASPNFNGLAISRLPDRATTQSSNGATLPTAVVLGLLLGIVLSVMWERLYGRIDDQLDLEKEVNVPVSQLEELSNEGIVALLQRWQTLASPEPLQAAIVPAAAGGQAFAAGVAAVFDDVAALENSTNPTSKPFRISLLPAGAPATTEVGEHVAQQATLVALLVQENTPVATVRNSIKTLSDFGVRPAWALYASAKVVRQAERRTRSERDRSTHDTVIDVDQQTGSTTSAPA